MTTTDGVDDRTPVLVGVGQLSQRVDQGAPPLEPAALMAEVVQAAMADAGAPALIRSVDSIRVMNVLSWPYRDPGAEVARRTGATPSHTSLTVLSGNYPQTTVNQAAADIAAGRAEVVVVCGAEAWRSRAAARTGDGLGWTTQGSEVSTSELVGGSDPELSSPEEVGRGVFLPIQVYPMFDVALRSANGLGVDEHRQHLGELWSRFSDVAATNPHAWIQRRFTAGEIATPSPDNRMVGFPYTKLMNSNNNVEQGAAVVLCSAGAARAAGIPSDRWVFPHAGTDAHDHWYLTQRQDLHRSPAISIAGRRALELAGVDGDDLAHVDLYSCFPSAVQIAANELGLGLDRQLTVTGGMSFAGGPWGNYVTHAIATMADVLRNDPGSVGLVTGNGGYLTKHSFGVYSTTPPTVAYRWADCQAQVDATPQRVGAPDHHGPVTIETYTVMHGRDGAETALAACLTAGGERCWAHSTEGDLMTHLMTNECVGATATIDGDGTLRL